MSDIEVKWAKGYPALLAKIRQNRDVILNGKLLAIDPASFGSSVPGFAIFEGGVLLTSGTLPRPPGTKRDTYLRLQYLYEQSAKLLPGPPDVLLVEEIHKAMAPVQLLWATGVSIAAVRAPVTIEVALNFWKSLAKATPGYVKGDAMDAEMIGASVILWAQQHTKE